MVWPFTASYPERTAKEVDGQTFDYIVVGGGTAGCVLASRLSENPFVRVLLLSRGEVADNFISRVPLLPQAMRFDGPQIELLHSEPDSRWPGKAVQSYTSRALGGASRVNSLLLTRGAPANYNHWAELGNDQWSFEQCEPWFRKMEDASVCHPGAEHRGHDGPLLVQQIPSPFKIDQYWSEIAEELNVPVRKDGNDPKAPAMGLFGIDTMIGRTGHRISAFEGYLPASLVNARRGRLFVCSNVVATKLEIDETTSKVTGVRVLDVGGKGSSRTYHVKAKREVVVTCGAMFTPQILMLSGIGPKKDLEAHKIPVVRDLPGVGDHLKDHVAFGLSREVHPSDSLTYLARPWIFIWHMVLFILFKTGILVSMPTKQALWVRSGAIDDENMAVRAVGDDEHGEQHDNMDASRTENLPDLEFMFIGAPFDLEFSNWRGYTGIFAALAQPFSSGRISLASDDPLAKPLLHHPLLTDPRDWAVARKAARFGMHFLEKLAHTSYSFKTTWYVAPGIKRGSTEGTWRDPSDEEIDEFIKKGLEGSLHMTSSCRMAREDEGGVVGQDLRVHGFSNLRVADASVFPTLPSTHTVAAVYMVAERCADFIKKDWAAAKKR